LYCNKFNNGVIGKILIFSIIDTGVSFFLVTGWVNEPVSKWVSGLTIEWVQAAGEIDKWIYEIMT